MTAKSPGIDTETASIARVYDAILGGKDNYAVDRQVVEQIKMVAPEVPQMARDNREWLIRVTRFLAGNVGISQFLDCGSGLPAAENTHEAAQRVNSDAQVVYVDNDPVVLAHGRALLQDNEDTKIVDADITKPHEVMEHPDVTRHLDLDEPIAFYQIGTLHHFSDADDPAGMMHGFIDALPSGSYVAITHFYNPGGDDGEVAQRLEEVMLAGSMGSGYFRPKKHIEALFPGVEMIQPGLVPLADWWPDGPRVKPLTAVQRCMLGGLARKL
jgi:hypothetical protein